MKVCYSLMKVAAGLQCVFEMVSIRSFELSVQFRVFNCLASRALRELLSQKANRSKLKSTSGKLVFTEKPSSDPPSFFLFNSVLNLIGVKRGMSLWRTT